MENTNPQEAQVTQEPTTVAPVTQPTPAVEPAPTSNPQDEFKQQASIAWAAAPFYSPTLKGSSSEFVRAHAEASYYFGISSLVALVGLFAFNFLFWNVIFQAVVGGNPFTAYSNYGTFSLIGNVVSWAVWIFVLAPRVYGIIKAQNMEIWSVPKVKDLVSKYIKF